MNSYYRYLHTCMKYYEVTSVMENSTPNRSSLSRVPVINWTRLKHCRHISIVIYEKNQGTSKHKSNDKQI